MKPSLRNYLFYLEDIAVSMQRIQRYISDINFTEFENNFMISDAVVRNFEIIGEAARHVPTEIRKKYLEIPWQKMSDLRNIVIHEYFGIDYEMIWELAKNELPVNQIDLHKIIAKEKSNLPDFN